jgi:hypothetical protein
MITGEPPMRSHSRKLWPPFAAVVVLALVGLLLLDGVVATVALMAAVVGFFAAAIFAVRGESEGVVGLHDDRRRPPL